VSKKDRPPRIVTLDGHFAGDDQAPVDAERYITHMRSSLSLVATSIGKMRELGMPMTDDKARRIEGNARFGLGEKGSSASQK